MADSKSPNHKSRKNEARRLRKRKIRKLKLDSRQIIEASLYSLLVLGLICIAFLGRQPMGPQILLNQPAPTRIVAEFPFEYTSEIIRQRQARAIRAQIPPVFKRSDAPFLEFSTALSNLQNRFAKVLIEFEDEDKERLLEEKNKATTEWIEVSGLEIDPDIITELFERTNPKERAKLFEEALEALHSLYQDGIYTAPDAQNTNSISVIQLLDDTSSNELPAARTRSAAEIALRRQIDSISRNDKTARALFSFFNAGLKDNLVYSETDTAAAIDQAIFEIEPTLFAFTKGDTLIEPAATIEQLDLERMEQYSAAALEDGNDPTFFNALFLERLVLTAFLLIAIGLFLKQGLRNYPNRTQAFVISAVCLLVNLFIIRLILEFGELVAVNNRGVLSILPYFAPYALAPILVAALTGMTPAIFTALVIATLFGISQGNSIEFTLIAFLSGVVGAYYSNNIRSRTRLFRAGLFAGLAAAIAAIMTGILSNFSAGLITELFFLSLLIGVLSGIIAVGVLPLLEHLFKITTDITLLELTDFNHPLLRRMQVEAPGTYHHSLMVANLSENAAAAIGASPLLCRVCCFFHDIGKLVKPEYFTENQRDGLNPHDEKNPSMSALVIKAHVKEGIELARDHKLPHVIHDVIQQHHGTTLIQYFYHQARERLKEDHDNNTPVIDQSTYRYDGPRPAFKESAIIFFADGVEAASRTLPKVTQSNIEDLIDKIFRDRIEDGQLDDCPLTFQELNKIRESFVYTLLNMLHSRVEYPKDDNKNEPAPKATASS
ncbi:MAG: Cyclic-di-AMP phosphodiesterase PgpH [Opitutia bacterium UBA7350]|nr:MAG: Cyclic-di-AMP phosphodiesterase PgpH [Opitutae bacterium UBA7350]